MKNKYKIRRIIFLAIILLIISFMIYLLTNKEEVLKEILFNNKIENQIISISVKEKGIELIANINEDLNNIKDVSLCPTNDNKNCYKYIYNKEIDNSIKSLIDLSEIKNGEYQLVFSTDKKNLFVDKNSMDERINRFRHNNKLITFSYANNNITIKIENHKFEYDIIIDPGHGGFDTGASYNKMFEKDIALEQSLYEKKRFEDHGLKVFMTREDDTYGITMGENDWTAIKKRAYAVGYYGVVSKYSYSNHLNANTDKRLMGWEVILPSNAKKSDNQVVYSIIDDLKTSYKTTEKHMRVFAREYYNAEYKTKENGEIYNFKDYYAIIREPKNLFNVDNILYENSYMSNIKDFQWYYINKNWKIISEIKIKNYVEALGKTYKK